GRLAARVRTDEVVRRYARCILAEARLFTGDAVEALEITAAMDGPPSIKAFALGVRIAAQVALRRQSDSSLEDAFDLLNAPDVAVGTKLGLYSAVTRALEWRGEHARVLALRREARGMISRLSDTLEPALRTRFLTHWNARLEAGVRVKTKSTR
ncbi:MAG: hypothetical protein HC933_19725, partial [Pleurocapsa sp. SU_196_0]|nr:hypothetical protein [Pleurocapsa sp. SU_196_0]